LVTFKPAYLVKRTEFLLFDMRLVRLDHFKKEYFHFTSELCAIGSWADHMKNVFSNLDSSSPFVAFIRQLKYQESSWTDSLHHYSWYWVTKNYRGVDLELQSLFRSSYGLKIWK
jgi:hypothetical protein